MSDYEIFDTNADNIDGCSLCGNKNTKNLGRRRKANWLKERYAEGLRYKVLRSEKFGDIGMIEYAPGSHAWRPVEAEGYLVMHCLPRQRRTQRERAWVSTLGQLSQGREEEQVPRGRRGDQFR